MTLLPGATCRTTAGYVGLELGQQDRRYEYAVRCCMMHAECSVQHCSCSRKLLFEPTLLNEGRLASCRCLCQRSCSAKAMQLWWSPYGRTPQEGGLKRKHSRLLQYSSLISRVLQRDGATTAGKNHHQQQQNTGQPASAPTSLSVIQPCELFGGASKRQRVQQQQAAAEASGSRPPPAAWVCCNHVPEGDAGSLPGG